jgi:2-polyprenyl-3-methyl-5-hydroxy-6-metoxy-1,4-benzoquinol methylase
MAPSTHNSERACPVTGTHETTIITSKDRHGTNLVNVCWKNSGFVGVDPIPLPDVEQFYETEYRQQYKGTFHPQQRHILRAARCALDRFRRMSPYLTRRDNSPLHTLDAGSSSGEFVFLMEKLGHSAFGVEPNAGYASHAKERLKLNIANCTFSKFQSGQERFDVVTLFHVLEHLEFPVQELERLSDLMLPDGLFFIEVPNIFYRGMKFSHKWHKAHLSGFSARTLEITAARAGLQALICGEIGDGGNLFGVFKKGAPISKEEASDRLKGHFQEATECFQRNSDLNYYTQLNTWLKIPSKLKTQIEERRTAGGFSDSIELLNKVFESEIKQARYRAQ